MIPIVAVRCCRMQGYTIEGVEIAKRNCSGKKMHAVSFSGKFHSEISRNARTSSETGMTHDTNFHSTSIPLGHAIAS